MMPSTVGRSAAATSVGIKRDEPGARGQHIPTLDHEGLALGGGVAEADLDVLGGELPDHELVLLAKVLVQRHGHLVARDPA